MEKKRFTDIQTIYPRREGADEELKAVVMRNAGEKGFSRPEMMKAVEDDLAAIKTTGSASGYLMVMEALNATDTQKDEYWFGGSITSGVVPFLTGMSDNNPFDLTQPRVYPEFYYRFNGKTKEPGFDIRVSEDLGTRLREYFSAFESNNPEAGVQIEMEDYKYDWLKVFVISDKEDDEHKNMYINILPFKTKEKPIERILDEEIRLICEPNSFEDYVKCFGLSKGIGIWEDNMKDLLSNGAADLKNVIANREDVYELLMNAGMEKTQAFRITEDIIKGRINRRGWDEKTRAELSDLKLPEWFWDCGEKIKYLWPRSHAMSFLRFHCACSLLS